MDQETPTQKSPMSATTQPNEPPKKNKGISIVFKIVLAIVFIIIIFGALNYFNILRLSEIFTGYLGWLPHRTIEQSKQPASPAGGLSNETTQQSNNATNQQSKNRLKLSCPSVKEFCDKGEDIFKDQRYFGLGYKLSSGSEIFAVFDGDLTSTVSSYFEKKNGTETQKKYLNVNLANEDLGMKAIYLFRGEVIRGGKVNKGEQIAVSNGKKISIHKNSSLVFSINNLYGFSEDALLLNKEYFE